MFFRLARQAFLPKLLKLMNSKLINKSYVSFFKEWLKWEMQLQVLLVYCYKRIIKSFKVGNIFSWFVLTQMFSLSLHNNKQTSLSWAMVDQNRNVSRCWN